jgi:hypothetical protein
MDGMRLSLKGRVAASTFPYLSSWSEMRELPAARANAAVPVLARDDGPFRWRAQGKAMGLRSIAALRFSVSHEDPLLSPRFLTSSSHVAAPRCMQVASVISIVSP